VVKFPELGKNVSLLVRIRKFEKKEYKKEKYLYTTKDGQEVALVKSFWKGKYTLEIKLSARPNDPLEKVVELDGYTYVPANGDKSLDEVIDFSRIRKVD